MADKPIFVQAREAVEAWDDVNDVSDPEATALAGCALADVMLQLLEEVSTYSGDELAQALADAEAYQSDSSDTLEELFPEVHRALANLTIRKG